MAILSKGTDFTTGDQVTATKLDELVDNATFASGAVDDSTTQIDGSGRIIVKDSGITSAKLNLSATGASQNIITFTAVQDSGERRFHIRTPASTSDLDSPFEFFTGNAFKFLIDSNEIVMNSSGHVGIGTTTPTEKLQVVGDIKATNGSQSVLLNDTGSIELNHASNAFIDFKNGASEDFDSRIHSNSNGLAFSTGGDGSTATRMTIASDGKVGIGATSPAQELEVVGDITANSLIAREASTDNSLRLLSDPEAPDGTNGGSQIELFAQEASTASQIYHKARFHKFQTIGSSATDVLDIATDSGHLKLYNIPGSAPSTPSGGGVLYVQSGALKYKGSGGTETTIAPA